jgi:hypothetical protein
MPKSPAIPAFAISFDPVPVAVATRRPTPPPTLRDFRDFRDVRKWTQIALGIAMPAR